MFVAVYGFPSTVTVTTAVASSTEPVNCGVVSFVVRKFTVTTGAVVSMTNSFEVESFPVLPAGSVALAATS